MYFYAEKGDAGNKKLELDQKLTQLQHKVKELAEWEKSIHVNFEDVNGRIKGKTEELKRSED